LGKMVLVFEGVFKYAHPTLRELRPFAPYPPPAYGFALG